ncbi:hypothetical protein PENSPDRAFT_671098 [Peniophora sp. CONT]|nr:hypothetical protein PENSPDRAFT_671098 [Peniophora sp. CONT]
MPSRVSPTISGTTKAFRVDAVSDTQKTKVPLAEVILDTFNKQQALRTASKKSTRTQTRIIRVTPAGPCHIFGRLRSLTSNSHQDDMPPVPSRSKRGASAEEDKPSWNGTTDEPESPKPKPKRRDPTQGTYKAGRRRENATGQFLLPIANIARIAGYRADLPEKATTNPSMQHREQVCSTLLGSEGTA